MNSKPNGINRQHHGRAHHGCQHPEMHAPPAGTYAGDLEAEIIDSVRWRDAQPREGSLERLLESPPEDWERMLLGLGQQLLQIIGIA